MTLPKNQKITAVILAGGRSQRMGSDKSWVEYDNGQITAPMIKHVIKSIKPHVDRIIINTNSKDDRYSALPYPCISDNNSDFNGPLAGIEVALAHCDTPYLLVLPCDIPNLPNDLVFRLVASCEKNKSYLHFPYDGKQDQHLCLLIDTTIKPLLTVSEQLISGNFKVKSWILNNSHSRVDFGDHDNAFSNINTPKDLVL